jgi:hypothetical protein
VLTSATPFSNGQGPAFRAAPSTAQTITTATYTKVTLGTETFDTNGNFASSTFTPTVAGYYQINATVLVSGSTGITNTLCAIYKNGIFWQASAGAPISSTSAYGTISALLYLNGSTDYVELYVRSVATGTITTTASQTELSGFLARAA